jgi:predicted MFS family arabinose efflux permease
LTRLQIKATKRVVAAASTLLQAYIPNDKRGRAGSAMNTVITLASVVSMGLSDMLGDALGVRQVFYLSGLITVFAGLLAAILMRLPAPADARPGFAVNFPDHP